MIHFRRRKTLTSADLISTFRKTPEVYESHGSSTPGWAAFARCGHYKEKAGFDQAEKSEKIMAARI